MPGYSVYSTIEGNDNAFAGELKTFKTDVKATDEIDDKFIDNEATKQKNAVVTGNAATEQAAKKVIDDKANALKTQLKQYYVNYPSPQMRLDDLTQAIDDLKKKRDKVKKQKFDPLEFAAIHISNWFIKGLLTFIQLGMAMGTMLQQSNKVRKELHEIDKLIAETEKQANTLEAEIAATAALTPPTADEDQGTEFAGRPGHLAPDGTRIDAPHPPSGGQLDESDDEGSEAQHDLSSSSDSPKLGS